MSKDIAFDNETRTKMAAGVNKLADAVRVTIGPKGRYVAIQKEHEKPNVSNDGATVAANVDLEDPIENMGMKIVREAPSPRTTTRATAPRRRPSFPTLS